MPVGLGAKRVRTLGHGGGAYQPASESCAERAASLGTPRGTVLPSFARAVSLCYPRFAPKYLFFLAFPWKESPHEDPLSIDSRPRRREFRCEADSGWWRDALPEPRSG